MVSEKQPRQTFPAAHLPTHPDTMGQNNTLTALNGCGVKRKIVFATGICEKRQSNAL